MAGPELFAGDLAVDPGGGGGFRGGGGSPRGRRGSGGEGMDVGNAAGAGTRGLSVMLPISQCSSSSSFLKLSSLELSDTQVYEP